MSPFNKVPVVFICIISLYIQMVLLVFLFTDQVWSQVGMTSLFILLAFILCGTGFSLNLSLVSLVYSSNKSMRISWLNTMVEHIAAKANVPQPEVFIVDAAGINAFALESLFGRGYVLLNKPIFSSLTQDEIEAVLAHEMCHIAKNHARSLTFVQGMTVAMTIPIAFLISSAFCLVSGWAHFRRRLIKFNGLALIVLFPLTSLFVLFISRRWEFEADRSAAEIVGRHPYLQVLRCLHGSFFQYPPLLSGSSGLPVDDAGPLLRRLMQPIMVLSHPSLAQRIDALQESSR